MSRAQGGWFHVSCARWIEIHLDGTQHGEPGAFGLELAIHPINFDRFFDSLASLSPLAIDRPFE